MKLYLDVCCLNRPFDDQRQERVRAEANAVERIIDKLHMREWEWVGSNVIDLEVSRTPNPERRLRVGLLSNSVHYRVTASEGEMLRAREVVALGFSPIDALHIASAESGGMSVFLTTDDKLLRAAERSAADLKLAVRNPLAWLQEVGA
jgi:predicted nucleic acid-binding protein